MKLTILSWAGWGSNCTQVQEGGGRWEREREKFRITRQVGIISARRLLVQELEGYLGSGPTVGSYGRQSLPGLTGLHQLLLPVDEGRGEFLRDVGLPGGGDQILLCGGDGDSDESLHTVVHGVLHHCRLTVREVSRFVCLSHTLQLTSGLPIIIITRCEV